HRHCRRSPADATEGNEPKTSRKNGKAQWFGTGDSPNSAAGQGNGGAAVPRVGILHWRVRPQVWARARLAAKMATAG
ncbi:hypothetical protein KGQ20_28235, partial [Catenulispora sp. NF23]|uniref:hypothetical protein n=1 Tax=Catenulispora pinistramenti TaxID=2705254 RepID=UPI001BAA34D6